MSTITAELIEELLIAHSNEAAILLYPDGKLAVSALCWERQDSSGTIVYTDLHHQIVQPVMLKRDLLKAAGSTRFRAR